MQQDLLLIVNRQLHSVLAAVVQLQGVAVDKGVVRCQLVQSQAVALQAGTQWRLLQGCDQNDGKGTECQCTITPQTPALQRA